MRFGDQTFTAYLGKVSTYNDGDIIFEEGTAGGWVYVVAFGEVEIFKRVAGKKVIIDRVLEGEVLGETSFFDQSTRSASAQAKGKVGLMKFDDSFLSEEYEKLPHCYKVIMEAMAKRLRSVLNKMVFLANNPEALKLITSAGAGKKSPEE